MREPFRASGGPRAVMLASLAACGVAVAGWSWPRGDVAPPVPDAAGADSARAPAAPAELGGVADEVLQAPAAPPTERIESPMERGEIVGTARVASGEPLVGCNVHLRRADAGGLERLQDKNRQIVRTDARGQFRFADLEPAKYSVQLTSLPASAREVVLDGGATVEVQLRAPGPVVVGRITNRGEPFSDWRVRVQTEDGDERVGHPDREGEFHLQLDAGRHRAIVTALWSSDAKARRELVVLRTELDVPPATALLRRDLHLALTRVELVADPGNGAGVDGLSFEVRGRSRLEDGELSFEVAATSKRHAFLILPAGVWKVRARAPAVVESAPIAMETSEVAEFLRVVVPVEPAAVVQLAMQLANGSAWSPPAYSEALLRLLPALRMGDRILECERLDEGSGGLAGRPRIGWKHVPLGAARLDDRGETEAGDEVEFLPFDPLEARTFDVQPGDNRIEVTVEPRAFVTFVACERGGREDTRARIRVFAGGRRVRPACSPDQSRWQAFLPPGEYRVAIDRVDGTTESVVFVQRDSITLRLRP